MSQIARTAARLLGALVLFAALIAPGRAEPMQGQVIRDGVPLTLPDGYKTMPYLSPRGGLLVEPIGRPSSPLTVRTMPFQRLHSVPIRLKGLTTTPQVFQISRPADATTYRVVVPCNVNIRLLGAKTADEVLTDDNGVLYLAGTDVTMGTSKPDFIIAKTTAVPDGDCTPEMHYGMGGG